MYGEATDATKGPWGQGMFSVDHKQTIDPNKTPQTHGVRILEVKDGTSNTLFISEGVVATIGNAWGGPMGETIYGNMGGSLLDRKSTRLNSSHVSISYAVFCLKKK